MPAEIGQVSNERVRDELTRMLTEGHARRAFELLDESGLLAEVLPEVTRMHGVEQPPQYHPEGDVWVHTMMLLDHLPAGASSTLGWGMLLHDVGKPATFQPPQPGKAGDRIRFNGHVEVGVRIAEEMLSRLRFSNEECAQIVGLVKNHMRFGDVGQMKDVDAEAVSAAAEVRGAPCAASCGLPELAWESADFMSLRKRRSSARSRRSCGRSRW